MTEYSACDHQLMARALQLAAYGLYTSQPNPRVGCVIAQADKVVGEGFHARAGTPHAEVHALAAASGAATGATAYVTLEPCAHFGRTPPCAEALIKAQVARVVVATGDPFEPVCGQGFSRLCAAGIRVDVGLMQGAARELNIGFFSRIERSRPFVRLKMALSLDGRSALATGESRWISNAAARADGHHFRARASAILTGIGTVLADDPQLTVRIAEAHGEPLRVVLDRRLRMPLAAQMLVSGVPPLIYCGSTADAGRHADLQAAGAEVVMMPAVVLSVPPLRGVNQPDSMDGDPFLLAVMADLAARGVNELQVEAGATLAGALIAAGLVDELLIYQSGCLLGSGARPMFDLAAPLTMAGRREWQLVDSVQITDNWRLRLRPKGL